LNKTHLYFNYASFSDELIYKNFLAADFHR